jgi:hypothetical protein
MNTCVCVCVCVCACACLCVYLLLQCLHALLVGEEALGHVVRGSAILLALLHLLLKLLVSQLELRDALRHRHSQKSLSAHFV